VAFELAGASVCYDGRTALEAVDLVIEPGEAVAFVGPSGAGKTTALRLLNAGAVPTAGRVRVDGEDLAVVGSKRTRELRSRIGFIPQDLGLVPNLRASQNVLAGRLGRLGLYGSLRSVLFPRHAELEALLAILDRLGIGEKLFHRVDSLSGGEKQRVAIARALYQQAGALLADEPLSALDPARARETLALLVQVTKEHGMTLVLSMHDIDLAREFLPRLVGLRRGRVQFDLPTAEVPASMLTELYQLEERERVG
jgi:phosphonate transport system ATP-binding protein